MAKKDFMNSVQVKRPGLNVFDLTHDMKFSCRFGELIPTLCKEVLPGDIWQLNCEALVRFAPMTAPVMNRFDVYTHYFFVPNRLIWENFENFITNTDVLGFPPAHPFLFFGLTGTGSAGYTDLMDYFGLPNPSLAEDGSNYQKINALPFAAYQRIYNDYYRDENLVDEVTAMCIDRNNTAVSALYQLRRRAFEKDYLTSALPFAQKGEPVNIPVGDFNNVSVALNRNDGPGSVTVDTTPASGATLAFFDGGPTLSDIIALTEDLQASAVTVNDFRTALAIQRMLELDARGGTRYDEVLKAHFATMPQDSRLQRPEYITGMKTPIKISEVLNTTGAAADGSLPQGNMSGHGVTLAQGNYGKYVAQEHGFIMGITSVMAKASYSQGIERQFLKYTDRYEYAWPTLAHLGEQPIYNNEVYAFSTTPDGMDTWGYQPRFAEYKTALNRLAGEFRTTLSYWTASRNFGARPPLNQEFIEQNADYIDQIFANTDPEEDKLYIQLVNNLKVVRALPKFGIPSIY